MERILIRGFGKVGVFLKNKWIVETQKREVRKGGHVRMIRS